MPKDVDAIRKIILTLNKTNSFVTKVKGIPKNVFNYYSMLLIEAGLALGSVHENISKDTSTENFILIHRLTRRGHEFADLIIDDAVWEKAKTDIIKLNNGFCTLEILKNYLYQENTIDLKG